MRRERERIKTEERGTTMREGKERRGNIVRKGT